MFYLYMYSFCLTLGGAWQWVRPERGKRGRSDYGWEDGHQMELLWLTDRDCLLDTVDAWSVG